MELPQEFVTGNDAEVRKDSDKSETQQNSSDQNLPLPLPASWPAAAAAAQQYKQGDTLRGVGKAAAASSLLPIAVMDREAFDEKIEVPVPTREATMLVRVAGRELAASKGVVMVLHGVSTVA